MAGSGIEAIQLGAPKKSYKVSVRDLYPYQYNQRLDTFGFSQGSDVNRIVDALKSDTWEDMSDEEYEYICENLGDEDNDSSMAWLKKSLLEEGLKEACTGFFKAGRVYLTEGNRRLFAARIALLEDPDLQLVFRVDLEAPGSSDIDYVKRQLIVNSKNRNSPFEQALTIRQIMRMKQLEEFDEIREELKGTIFYTKTKGNDIKLIRDRLALLEAAPEIQQAVLRKEISPTTVVSALRSADSEEEQEIATEAIKAAVAKNRDNGGKRVTSDDVIIEKSRLSKLRKEYRIEGDVQSVEDVLSGKMLPKMKLPDLTKVTSRDVMIDELIVFLNNPDFPEDYIRQWWKQGKKVWNQITR